MNLYEELNISENANQKEIKKAYHEAAKKNHPDKNGNPEKMKRINKAYMILRDPEKRKRYDETGDENQMNFEISRMIEILIELVDVFIENPPPNMKKTVLNIKQKWTDSFQSEKINQEKKKEKIEIFRKRILKKPKNENDYIGNYLNKSIEDINFTIERMEKNFKIRMDAIDFFLEYKFSEELQRIVFNFGTDATASATNPGW